ncbi:hypothetical protein FA15DRAFT_759217 [Coprinopsis marcescibilis]|uniref:DUF6533 domain-containing protein n=1 Tax=Coprinopsis marcescibilis TaxID=230819 RepID=A0A5C3KL64_COPMA|nr:hypothetical protein FA15DRAFT_759217 [Coprinopsis marcescibilis]
MDRLLRQFATLIQGAHHKRALDSVQVSLLVLLIIDYLQTVNLEVKYIWKAQRSFVRTMFLLARYTFLVTGPISIWFSFAKLSAKACHTAFSLACFSTLTMVLFAEAILFIRVYAISGRSKFMLGYLIFHFTAAQVAKYTLLAKSLSTVKFMETVVPRALNCLPEMEDFGGGRAYMSAVFGLSAASEVVIFLIMCWFALRKFRDCGSDLYTIFFRDGVVYFVCLTAISITNMFMNLFAATIINLMFASFQAVASLILSTRMILQLRQASQMEVVIKGSKGLPPRSEESAPQSLGSMRFMPWRKSGLDESWGSGSGQLHA